ncbi:hypothetical protein [Clostridium estertheticum]|uniref:hypothetical protein n=1 Tax=Clostridium estertheticum TaxID=238834 RepID=UPI00227A6F9F|nr:hypothetical protein [Clostridium estertheticum]
MTSLLYLFIDDAKCSSYTYGTVCIIWEACEWWNRGYFQFDQLIFDFLGVTIFMLIYLFSNVKFNNKTSKKTIA